MSMDLFTQSELIEMDMNAQRGAMMLDDFEPEWFKKIDLDQFNLSDPNFCICGQVFLDKIGNSYANGYSWAAFHIPESINFVKLGFVAAGFIDNEDAWFDKYGFEIFTHVSKLQYEFTAMCWITQIEKRLAETGDMA